MIRRLCVALATLLVIAVVLGTTAPAARAASDPSLRWSTIHTPHFRITYHSGLEQVAQHVASVAEGIYDKMGESVGWKPGEITEILLADSSESANGSAGALPYNAVRLLVTAPEDMSPLGDVDDWYLELVTHEYTHILHTDHIRGLPAIVNAVLGKTLAPNQVQPRWILEGLGVYEESARTSAGRLRNSQWDMFMRADVLGDNVASIDQLSNIVRRWPQGNLYYLYGSYFTEWIAQTYGEEALRKMADDYGKQIIPWGFNRSIRRATGSTFIEMYPQWIASMKQRYEAQATAIRKSGIREGTRLTHHGQTARYPRWIPKNAWPEYAGGLLYYREDQHIRPGLWAVPVTRDAKGAVVRVKENEADTENMARMNGEAVASFTPDGSVVFGSQEFFRNVFLYGDLERLPPGKRSTFGLPDGGRVRLTHGVRAADPTVSPDGRRVVFNINRYGTRSLQIGDLHDESVENVRELVPSSFMEQAFTPRWSPDGTHVAYSVWKRGGYRDIRYVDVRDGTFRDLTNDRAVDGSPSFSADGRWLFFHSDRTGVMNLYAWELATDRVRQVTNVLTGAYMPEPSPDGKTLAYIGYTTEGFDLFAMPLDEATWTEAEPYVDTRPPAPTVVEKQWDVKPYNAWHTLLPRRYGVQITEGSFGRVIGLTASQSDLTGFHTVTLTSVTELEKPVLQGSLAYSYGRLPFDMGIGIFRSIAPRGGYALGSYRPTVIQETAGLATSLAYTQPTAAGTSSYVITHSLARTGAELPLPVDKLDPYETPTFPARGLTSSLHLGYSYSNAERYLWSVGPERGFSLGLGFDLTDPRLGSQFAGFVSNGDLTVYYLMPWLKHHSVALHAGAGTSGGVFPGRGAFYVGSFVDLPLIDTVRNVLIQGGITLRGYPPVIVAGRSYALGNIEYRFPIVNIDHGPSTLPIFLNRITGNVFLDYGSAFDLLDGAQFKTGTGAELWFDSTLGYILGLTFRLGYARGLSSGGLDKVYFVAAVPY
ncbi:MAG: tolB protein precursor [Labilithrix sp.]|nr:tolB protein precursor [Labilithrix sp.]